MYPLFCDNLQFYKLIVNCTPLLVERDFNWIEKNENPIVIYVPERGAGAEHDLYTGHAEGEIHKPLHEHSLYIHINSYNRNI